MKKLLLAIFIVISGFSLSACVDLSSEKLSITLNPGIDTVELESSYTDAGATAFFGTTELEVEVISNNVDVESIGVYEIVYQASYLDIEKTITRKVTVVDETLPIVTLNAGQDTIYVGDTWIDAGVDSTEFINVYRTGNVDVNSPGEYVLTYRITGRGGIEVFLYRYVNVIER